MRETAAPRLTSTPRLTSRLLLAAAATVAVALAGTIWLWAQYGTTIFFETIRSGFVACFG